MVQRVHAIGDRRDRFVALKDVLETFRVITAERKRREIDPTLQLLEECLRETEGSTADDAFTRSQIQKMLEFTRMVSDWHSQIERLPKSAMMSLLRSGALLAKLMRLPTAAGKDEPGSQSVPSGVGSSEPE